MSNKVLAGDYEGWLVSGVLGRVVYIASGFKSINLDKSNVEAYEVITEEHRKSAASGVSRGIVGGVLLGPVGVIGGALSAKNKGTYQIAIQFKDGKKSLVEVDGKVHKALIRSLF